MRRKDEIKKLLRPAKKYTKLYEELKTVFVEARAKSHRVDFNWLRSKARQIYKKQEEDEGDNAIVRKHVIVNFICRHHLKYRRLQRNRGEVKEAYRTKLRWHSTFRGRTGDNQPCYDPKWGYFGPRQRFNVDQISLPFAVDCKKTYEIPEEEKKVWLTQHLSGAEKRFVRQESLLSSVGRVKELATQEMKHGILRLTCNA